MPSLQLEEVVEKLRAQLQAKAMDAVAVPQNEDRGHQGKVFAEGAWGKNFWLAIGMFDQRKP